MSAYPASAVSLKLPLRSLGMKLMLVSFLALLMTIPALFVWSLIDDRSHRADEVTDEVSAMVGGPETILGPALAVPYTVPGSVAKPGQHGIYTVFARQGDVRVETSTEVRHRSLFKVPVYRSQIVFDASFDLTGVPANAPNNATLDWNRAELLVGVSDPRGAKSDVLLNAAGEDLTLAPATLLQNVTLHGKDGDTQLILFGAAASAFAQPGAKFTVKSQPLTFIGAKRLAVLSYADTTTLSMKGDWQHPSFNGGFLPTTRNVDANGYQAQWNVPFIARGVSAQGGVESLQQLGRTAMAISFVELADPYQSVTRSLKYAVLFIGLVYLTYFLFEVGSSKRVHPAQYVLIGIAQLIFYLLLLSIAERIGFDLGFAIAAVATVALISAYAGWVFSRTYGLRALVAFSLLYGFIYLLLRLEDQALMVGSLASFAAIAAVMYFTRRMDWYASSTPESQPQGAVPLRDNA